MSQYVMKPQPGTMSETLWCELEEIDCPCLGEGWANIDDAWEECPLHFMGQLHPLSKELLMDDPIEMAEAERKAVLEWRVREANEKVRQLRVELQLAQHDLNHLELELVNRTPTSKMKAVHLPVGCYPTVQMKAVRPNETTPDPILDLSDVDSGS